MGEHTWAGAAYAHEPGATNQPATGGVEAVAQLLNRDPSSTSADRPAASTEPGEVAQPPPGGLPPGLENTRLRTSVSPATTVASELGRSSADLMPGVVRPDRQAASRGWRAVVRKATFGAIAPRAGRVEVSEAEDRLAVNAQFAAGKTVLVANPKGGAGKSPTAICLAATFGQVRGGGATVAWDNNETLGTLGIRTAPGRLPTTAVDLLANLEHFERVDAVRGDLGRFLRHQASGQFDVLVSDEDPARMSEIGDAEYDRIHRVLRRWNDVIVVDTGNNPRAANFLAAVESADLLVIPVRWAADVVVSAGRLIDQLRANGHGDLVTRAVTVITGPTASRAGIAEQVARWREWFAAQTAAVVEIPYDRHLAVGESIVYDQLAPATRRAYLRLAAEVARGFTDLDATTQYAHIKETHR